MKPMTKYPKLQTLYKRDMGKGPNRGAMMPDTLSHPVYGYWTRWRATEKVDGTNCRVHIDRDEGTVTFRGRNEVADNLSKEVLSYLKERFIYDDLEGQFPAEAHAKQLYFHSRQLHIFYFHEGKAFFIKINVAACFLQDSPAVWTDHRYG